MIWIGVETNLLRILDAASVFLNSSFVSAFLSALAGAGLGVWAAQRLSDRQTLRRELREALRQANALIILAHTIANQVLSLKKQHISPLAKNYFSDRKVAESINEMLLRGERPDTPITFQAELVHITPLTVPVEALKTISYSAQLVPGKAIAIVAMVEQSLTEFSHVVRSRSEQIALFKERELPVDRFVQTYFGLRREDGNTDAMYHDSMLAIAQYTDDIAFFAGELADELQAHANIVRKKLLELTKEAGKVASVDFSEARTSGLMPSREGYASWLSVFKSQT